MGACFLVIAGGMEVTVLTGRYELRSEKSEKTVKSCLLEVKAIPIVVSISTNAISA